LLVLLVVTAGVALADGAPNAWTDDGDRDALLAALDHQIGYLRRVPAARMTIGDRVVTREDLLRTATEFRALVRDRFGTPEFARGVAERFDVIEVATPDRPGFVTGYYAPELRASRAPTLASRYPIHRPPPRSQGSDPTLPTRGEIDRGALSGRGLEIAWTDDRLALYRLHVQGSGVLAFEDGTRRTVRYAGDNGKPYVSIGATLVAEGALTAEEATLPAIETILRAREGELDLLLWRNPRYVFFALDRGPIRGAGNIDLTPLRSVAADLSVLPLGGVVHLEYGTPAWNDRGEPLPEARAARFVVVQDTGAAIKGSGRIDLFTGSGDIAERLAGHLRHPGYVRVLLAK
jgi:membrane-bound lytic murein transglycosylase A